MHKESLNRISSSQNFHLSYLVPTIYFNLTKPK